MSFGLLKIILHMNINGWIRTRGQVLWNCFVYIWKVALLFEIMHYYLSVKFVYIHKITIAKQKHKITIAKQKISEGWHQVVFLPIATELYKSILFEWSIVPRKPLHMRIFCHTVPFSGNGVFVFSFSLSFLIIWGDLISTICDFHKLLSILH